MRQGFCRTLVDIVGWRHCDREGNHWIVMVPSWDSERIVDIPVSKAPEDLKIGQTYIVSINTGVNQRSDLQFLDWEPAPEPVPESELGCG
jgi:hypothetical protein